MSWTPTDEQALVEKAAFAIFAVGLDLTDPEQRQQAEEAWADMGGSEMDDERVGIEADARAVLVAVGPTIAAQALRDAGVAVETIDPAWDSALWTEGKYVPVPEWLNNRADQIEKEAGR